MVELFVNNERVDLFGNETIAVDYSIAQIGNFATRNGFRSVNFSVAKTANNRRIFESSEEVNNLTLKPYRRLSARILQDGIDQNIKFCDIEITDENYNLRLYGGNAAFFDLIKRPLAELDLSEFDHYHTEARVINSRTNNTGYIYPLIDYHADSPNAIISDANNFIDVQQMYPALFFETVLNKICEQNGYTLINNLQNKTPYNTAELILASTGGRRNTDFDSRYLATFTKYLLGGADVIPAGTDQPIDAWETVAVRGSFYNPSPFFETNIEFADAVEYLAEYNFEINNSGASATVSFGTIDTRADGTIISVDPFMSETVVNGANTFTGTFRRRVEIDPNNNCNSGIYVTASSANLTFDTGTFIRVLSGNIIGAGEIILNDISRLNYITVNSVFGKLKQDDLFKIYAQMFCALVTSDEITKTVTINSFDEIADNIPSAIDWSDKIDYSKIKELQFSFDKYTQRNNLLYKEDNSVIKPTGTDGVLNIDDETLNGISDLFTVPFAATEMVTRLQGVLLPQIKIFTTNGASPPATLPTQKAENRILLLERVSGDVRYRDGGGTPTTVTTNLPVAWFIRLDKDYNLGFGNSLIENFYNTLESVLTRTKIVTENIRLNSVDILNLDFMKPIFLQQHNAYFYISKIKNYSFGKTESTEVELVKIR